MLAHSWESSVSVGKLNGHLMASCVRNIRTKHFQNLLTGFQITVENVGDAFSGTQCICIWFAWMCLCVWRNVWKSCRSTWRSWRPKSNSWSWWAEQVETLSLLFSVHQQETSAGLVSSSAQRTFHFATLTTVDVFALMLHLVSIPCLCVWQFSDMPCSRSCRWLQGRDCCLWLAPYYRRFENLVLISLGIFCSILALPSC